MIELADGLRNRGFVVERGHRGTVIVANNLLIVT
jgi:hypothetical protein